MSAQVPPAASTMSGKDASISVNSIEKKSRPAAVALIALLVTMALRPTGCEKVEDKKGTIEPKGPTCPSDSEARAKFDEEWRGKRDWFGQYICTIDEVLDASFSGKRVSYKSEGSIECHYTVTMSLTRCEDTMAGCL